MEITNVTANNSGISFKDVLPTKDSNRGFTNASKRIINGKNYTQTELTELSDTNIDKTVNCVSIDWNKAYLPKTFARLSSDEQIQAMKTNGGIIDSTELLYIFDKLSELI